MITLATADLKKSLNRLVGIVQKRGCAPEWSCVHINALGEKAEVFGSNMDIDLTSTVDCQGEMSFLINHARLLGVIRSCPADEVRIEMSDDQVKISSGTFVAKLIINDGTLPHSDMPKNDTVFLDVAALGQSLLFASKDPCRYYLNGTHIGTGKGAINISSTDGKRLFRSSNKSAARYDINAIIPAAGVKKFVQLAKGQDRIGVAFSPSYCWYRGDDFEIVVRLIDGTFPDIDRAIPNGFAKNSMRTNMSNFASAAMRVTGGGGCVKVETNGQSVSLSYDRLDFSGSDQVEATVYNGSKIQTGFNAAYLRDIAKIFKGEVSIMEYDMPFLIRPDGSKSIVVLMPMRTQESVG
ncbi:MAG: DNA polymerase III subunit beta [Geminicoccaceae bacterium]